MSKTFGGIVIRKDCEDVSYLNNHDMNKTIAGKFKVSASYLLQTKEIIPKR